MNSKLPLVTSLVLGCVLSPVTTHALSLESRFVVHSGLIPDGDPNGRADLRSITGVDGRISDVDVYLRLNGTGPDGGWNGDIFAALRHDSGYAVLLNRPGRGAASE
ncbi:MAG: hypothetical protein JNL97_07570, partial [Verrucomicrobiales bacterium]|nr:hypothetical protein [Verrucomicrobiales bacterium]